MFHLLLQPSIYQELNERERADHATRKYDQLQSLVKQLEERNVELEQKFAEVCFVFDPGEELLKFGTLTVRAKLRTVVFHHTDQQAES